MTIWAPLLTVPVFRTQVSLWDEFSLRADIAHYPPLYGTSSGIFTPPVWWKNEDREDLESSLQDWLDKLRRELERIALENSHEDEQVLNIVRLCPMIVDDLSTLRLSIRECAEENATITLESWFEDIKRLRCHISDDVVFISLNVTFDTTTTLTDERMKVQHAWENKQTRPHVEKGEEDGKRTKWMESAVFESEDEVSTEEGVRGEGSGHDLSARQESVGAAIQPTLPVLPENPKKRRSPPIRPTLPLTQNELDELYKLLEPKPKDDSPNTRNKIYPTPRAPLHKGSSHQRSVSDHVSNTHAFNRTIASHHRLSYDGSADRLGDTDVGQGQEKEEYDRSRFRRAVSITFKSALVPATPAGKTVKYVQQQVKERLSNGELSKTIRRMTSLMLSRERQITVGEGIEPTHSNSAAATNNAKPEADDNEETDRSR